jgi:hypothetical protein
MTSRKYQPIDSNVADEISRLHRRHPKLGHDGLLDALRQAGVEVDPRELEAFMKTRRIKPQPFWRGLSLHGAPPWLVGAASVDGAPSGDADSGDGCD